MMPGERPPEPRFVLAPMDGMTHAGFRAVCFDYGADGATTEMIQSLAYGRAKKRMSPAFEETLLRLPEERSLAAQLIGRDPGAMAESARRLTALARFDAIEINMGCPARKVVGSGNGSALLKEPDLAERIMAAVREATPLPVRLKIRLGWDSGHIVAPRLVQAAEQLGYESVTIHGRTRAQMYTGAVDTGLLREICASARIPIYANGGVTCAADALDFLRDTGAAGVSIGRAALKQPWIFDDIRRLRRGESIPERLAPERISLLVRLAERTCRCRPERVAICEMRKFCSWWLSGLSGAEDILSRLNGVDTLDGFRMLLGGYLNDLTRASDTRIHPELAAPYTLDTVYRT